MVIQGHRKRDGAVENSRQVERRVEFQYASLTGYELGRSGIEFSRVFGIGKSRIMARKKLRGANKTSCVISSYSETFLNPLQDTTSDD
jgi:hypothetical protein